MSPSKSETAERDNQTKPVESEANPMGDTPEEWERIATGLGEQWDFAQRGDLVGIWINAEVVELKEAGLDGKKEATAYMFVTDDGEPVFLWQSYELTQALEKVGVGDRLKIRHKGQRDFTGQKGAQRVNVFEVFKSTGQQAIPVPEDGTNPLEEV